jgi:hypothetical protein
VARPTTSVERWAPVPKFKADVLKAEFEKASDGRTEAVILQAAARPLRGLAPPSEIQF